MPSATALTLLLLSAGCAHRREYAGPIVTELSFEEDRRFFRVSRGTADYHLRQAVMQEVTPRLALVPLLSYLGLAELDLGTLERDAWRLEVWYAHHGFFDARFQGWEVRTVRPARGGRPARVAVVGHVHEGAPTTVSEVVVTGMPKSLRALERSVLDGAPARVGRRFDLADHEATAAALAQRLSRASFARATVEPLAQVDPSALEARLEYRVDPGPACRFGPVTIEGAIAVPREVLDGYITIKEGRAYDAGELTRTQIAIFSLGAFSVVRVLPVLDDPSLPPDVVPVRVVVTEGRSRTLKVGGGLAFQQGGQELRASTRFEHTNLFRRLWNLQVQATGGYEGFSESLREPEFGPSAGPVASLSGKLRVPRAFGPSTTFVLDAELARDREPSGPYTGMEAQPSLEWRSLPGLTLLLGNRWSYKTDALDAALLAHEQALYGVDASTNLVNSLEQAVVVDRVQEGRRGWYARVAATEAGLLPVGSSYLGGEVELRRYFTYVPAGAVLAVRVAAAGRWPVAVYDNTQAYVHPLDRLYLGGGSDVRGWPAGHLGPRVEDEDGRVVPTGAHLAEWMGAEARVDAPYGLALAAFFDAGMAWSEGDLRSEDWFGARLLTDLQPSVGGGVRYGTPVGPIRLDFGWRLREDPRFPETRPWALHFAIGEAF